MSTETREPADIAMSELETQATLDDLVEKHWPLVWESIKGELEPRPEIPTMWSMALWRVGIWYAVGRDLSRHAWTPSPVPDEVISTVANRIIEHIESGK